MTPTTPRPVLRAGQRVRLTIEEDTWTGEGGALCIGDPNDVVVTLQTAAGVPYNVLSLATVEILRPSEPTGLGAVVEADVMYGGVSQGRVYLVFDGKRWADRNGAHHTWDRFAGVVVLHPGIDPMTTSRFEIQD